MPQGSGEGWRNTLSIGTAEIEPQIIITVRAAIVGQADEFVAVQCVDGKHRAALYAVWEAM